MSAAGPNPSLQIGHVLFLDIVGYSKLRTTEQRARLQQLTEIVLASAQVVQSSDEQLVKLPAGDGMALVFRHDAEEPAQCAVEIATALRLHPELPVRMGIHSGPVSAVTDVSGRGNLAGAGINLAQRVMDCGDAGHILLSKRVADDLEHTGRWHEQLHDLGECEVKHGIRLGIVNLSGEGVGNPRLPGKLRARRQRQTYTRWAGLTGAVILCGIIATVLYTLRKPVSSRGNNVSQFAAIPAKSIAVLPFANQGGDKDQQFFSDGLSEDFITALSQFAGLKVIGRNSAFQFRESKESARTIGERLAVAHLLEGSVRRAGATVRISAELINVRDGSTLWSQHYDRPYKDLFALQDEITSAVAGALQAKLLPAAGAVTQSDRPPSGNLAAYTSYLQGKFYFTRSTEADLHHAIAQYQKATRDDPRYALAWAGLSYSWVSLAQQFLGGQDAQQAYTKARAAANTALALEPHLAAAHGARGDVLNNADFEWADAQAEYRRALQLAPNEPSSLAAVGNASATLGQSGPAITLIRQALTTDPLHAIWYNLLTIYLSGLWQLDEATAASHKAIELEPAAAAFHEQLAIIEIQRGDARAALAAAGQEPPGPWQDVGLALARQIGPDHAAADLACRQLIAKWADAAPYQIAQVYALRRDPDQMFAWLDRAWGSRDPGIQTLLYDAFILRYQHDPRFAAFCRKVGLPASTDAKGMP